MSTQDTRRQFTGSNKPETIRDSYIVTLKPDLSKARYENHLKTVFLACERNPRLASGENARLVRVMSEPQDDPNPKSVTYYGNFNPDIEKKIRDTGDVSLKSTVMGTIH